MINTPFQLPLTVLNNGSGPIRPRTIRRIRQILIEEWAHFGYQVVQGKKVLNRGARASHKDYYKRVGTYWREGTGLSYDGKDDEFWSSTFICWVMQRAGVLTSEFPATRRHSKYIYDSLQSSGSLFQGRRLNEYKPKVGDLVCFSMSGWMKSYDKARNHYKYRSHGDIVVHTAPGVIWAIGGNVKSSVSLSIFKATQDGFLDPKQNIQSFFIAIQNNLPYDDPHYAPGRPVDCRFGPGANPWMNPMAGGGLMKSKYGGGLGDPFGW